MSTFPKMAQGERGQHPNVTAKPLHTPRSSFHMGDLSNRSFCEKGCMQVTIRKLGAPWGFTLPTLIWASDIDAQGPH
jgi:hypothetical protein